MYLNVVNAPLIPVTENEWVAQRAVIVDAKHSEIIK